MARHWSKLPPVNGYSRVPDEVGTGRRLLKCNACGRIIPSLGVGYHEGGGQANARPCTERDADRGTQPVPDWPRRIDTRPVYGPPVPTPAMLEDHARMLAWEAHCALPTSECEHATTPAGCWVHPAPIAVPAPTRWTYEDQHGNVWES